MINKKPFYIIGHNPNSIDEARDYFDKGANGLEPDIVHHAGQYYVIHQTQDKYDGVPTVQEYLSGLKDLLHRYDYNLAIIIWDIKTTNFDPNEFISLAKANFSGPGCDGVTMLMTHADDHDFLNRYNGSYENVGIGVDESNEDPLALSQIFRSGGQRNFVYADGITTFLSKSGVFENVVAAQDCRRQYGGESFGLIYTWVLSQESSLRKYLNTYIDAILVDAGAVTKLVELIAAPPYHEVYELAKNGYKPFDVAQPSIYELVVNTADTAFAGTDALVVFTLIGEHEVMLKSLPFNASGMRGFERGTTTRVPIEGNHIGMIKGLAVELVTGGPGAAWLPESISVPHEKVNFNFESAEWVTVKGGTVTKLID